MDSLDRRFEQMHFDNDDLPQNPRDCLMDLIQKVDNEHLQSALHTELQRLLTSQDRLVIALQQRARKAELENSQIKAQVAEYQRRYDKAVREMQFFKKKYDSAMEQAAQKVPSSNSSTTSSGHRTGTEAELPAPVAPLPWSASSTLPSIPGSPTTASVASTRLAPPPSIHSLSTDSSTFSDSRSAPSMRHNPSFHSMFSSPSSVYSVSTAPSVYSVPATPTRSTTSSNGYTGSSLIQQRRVDPLAFGGSEGLWDTIAKTHGNDATVEKTISNFLRRGGSPNTAKQTPSLGAVKYGYGMIHALIATKAQNALDLLLQQGANPNVLTLSNVPDDKVTPSYLAASGGWLVGLQKLVQAGADLTPACGSLEKTTLHVAAEHCHAAVVEYIVNCTQGALNQRVDKNGATVLHYAAQSGHTDLVGFLIRSCQVPVGKADLKGELPIHWAARAGRLEVVTMLVERYNCDINAYVPKKVGTPYDLAKSGNHKRLVDYLKGAGGLTAKKMEKKREEELSRQMPNHIEATLAKNGLLGMGFGGNDGFF